MATKIFGGTKPTGMLPLEYAGGLITQMSSSPRESGRLEISDPVTNDLVYKEITAMAPDLQVTLQGGTPPAIGGSFDASMFGVTGNYKVTGVGPAGNSGEFPSVTIYCEDFPD